MLQPPSEKDEYDNKIVCIRRRSLNWGKYIEALIARSHLSSHVHKSCVQIEFGLWYHAGVQSYLLNIFQPLKQKRGNRVRKFLFTPDSRVRKHENKEKEILLSDAQASQMVKRLFSILEYQYGKVENFHFNTSTHGFFKMTWWGYVHGLYIGVLVVK